MNNDIILLNNLKQVRQTKKISQEELAKIVGTTRQTIISIEKNQFEYSRLFHFFWKFENLINLSFRCLHSVENYFMCSYFFLIFQDH